jgi:UDP-N-acetylglucosamine 2-epimerase
MGISAPNKQLTINSRKHGAMTAEIIIQLEQEFESLNPSLILLYGDTNSTLAAAFSCC